MVQWNFVSVRAEDVADNFILNEFQAVLIHSDSVNHSHFHEQRERVLVPGIQSCSLTSTSSCPFSKSQNVLWKSLFVRWFPLIPKIVALTNAMALLIGKENWVHSISKARGGKCLTSKGGVDLQFLMQQGEGFPENFRMDHHQLKGPCKDPRYMIPRRQSSK